MICYQCRHAVQSAGFEMGKLCWVCRLTVLILKLKNKVDAMSDQLSQLTDQVTQLQAAETALANRINSQITALNAQIADLQAHPVAPDISTQIAGLQSVADGLNALLPNPSDNAPAPVAAATNATPTTATDTTINEN
jgi:hypothetical protein